MKIWCLFSIDQNYDQPDNNLVAWYQTKPSIEQLAKDLGKAFPSTDDETTLTIVNIWAGKGGIIFNTDYRLEEISEGKL